MGASSSRQRREHKIPRELCVPHGKYSLEYVDLKRLRRLIRARKLAPCYRPDVASDEEQLEECPICFMGFPALNQSSCCSARICTECFIQVQTNALPPGKAPCPFCKHQDFRVKFKLSASASSSLEPQEQLPSDARKRQKKARGAPGRGAAGSSSSSSSSSANGRSRQDTCPPHDVLGSSGTLSNSQGTSSRSSSRRSVCDFPMLEVPPAQEVGSQVQQQLPAAATTTSSSSSAQGLLSPRPPRLQVHTALPVFDRCLTASNSPGGNTSTGWYTPGSVASPTGVQAFRSPSPSGADDANNNSVQDSISLQRSTASSPLQHQQQASGSAAPEAVGRLSASGTDVVRGHVEADGAAAYIPEGLLGSGLSLSELNRLMLEHALFVSQRDQQQHQGRSEHQHQDMNAVTAGWDCRGDTVTPAARLCCAAPAAYRHCAAPPQDHIPAAQQQQQQPQPCESPNSGSSQAAVAEQVLQAAAATAAACSSARAAAGRPSAMVLLMVGAAAQGATCDSQGADPVPKGQGSRALAVGDACTSADSSMVGAGASLPTARVAPDSGAQVTTLQQQQVEQGAAAQKHQQQQAVSQAGHGLMLMRSDSIAAYWLPVGAAASDSLQQQQAQRYLQEHIAVVEQPDGTLAVAVEASLLGQQGGQGVCAAAAAAAAVLAPEFTDVRDQELQRVLAQTDAALQRRLMQGGVQDGVQGGTPGGVQGGMQGPGEVQEDSTVQDMYHTAGLLQQQQQPCDSGVPCPLAGISTSGGAASSSSSVSGRLLHPDPLRGTDAARSSANLLPTPPMARPPAADADTSVYSAVKHLQPADPADHCEPGCPGCTAARQPVGCPQPPAAALSTTHAFASSSTGAEGGAVSSDGGFAAWLARQDAAYKAALEQNLGCRHPG